MYVAPVPVRTPCLAYQQVQKAVQRLIAIWGERMVFGHSGSKPFNDLIAAAETPRKGEAGLQGLACMLGCSRGHICLLLYGL